MSTTERGQRAEALAASYLEARDLQIIARNWRTRRCELDLVARSSDRIHIIEIKYRANANHGDGFDYITFSKRERLIRAAEAWCQAHHYTGPYQIDVISVVGSLDDPTIEWLQSAIEA